MESPLDQESILTTDILTLSGDLQEGEPRGDYLVLKNVPCQTYLTVTRDQLRTLQLFRSGNCISEILPQLILDRRCPPLRELYELVIKAVRAGVLLTPGSEPPETVSAADWRGSIGPGLARLVGWALILFGVLCLALLDGVEIPSKSWEIALGYLLVAAGLSFGQVLAACALRGYDREVYRPHFHWRSAVPHFRVDTQDAAMGGRHCEATVALLEFAPVFLAAGAVAFLHPPLEYVLLLGCFFVTDPFTRSPAVDLLTALYRNDRPSTAFDFAFVQNKLLWTLLHSRIPFSDKKYLLAYSFYTLGWLGLLGWLNILIFDLKAGALIQAALSPQGTQVVKTVTLAVIAGGILVSAFLGLWIAAKNFARPVHAARQRTRRRVGKGIENLDHDEVVEFLAGTLLFGQLSPETVEKVAGAVEAIEVDARTVIIEEGDVEADTLYVVFSGKVDVLKELPTGLLKKICELRDGDVFGEIALLQDVPRTRTVRAGAKTVLLLLTRAKFNELVVASMGARKIEDTIQKQAFLTRIPLCRNWHPSALQRFAAMSVINNVPRGDVIIHTGHDNQFFYIVYEGTFHVKKGKKKLASLTTGDFFGEISLLQNSVSTADVVAFEDSKCLTVHKKDFIRFIGTDYFISMQFEEISSKRLRHPIFPLKGGSFETVGTR